jgi:hypothetical protein
MAAVHLSELLWEILYEWADPTCSDHARTSAASRFVRELQFFQVLSEKSA